MSINIPTFYAQSYSTNVALLLQQKGSMLRGTVEEGRYVGTQASPVDQVGKVEMQDVTERFAPMGRVDAATDRRWCFPSDFDLPQMVDTFDKLRLFSDPESKQVQNAVYAAGRKIDRVIITAFMANAKTGVSGATTTAFTAANEVDVAVGGANSKVNVSKLINVKRLMRANFVDFENDPIYIGLTAQDEESLYNQIQVISSDFAGTDRPVLQEGKVTRFLGMNFVYCELIESVATGTNEVNVPVWAKSGMHLGLWNDITTSIAKRHDVQGEPFQAYVYMTCGATRIEENKVYNIESYRA